ncbi:hypothetical protein [Kitasatospora griseola]|uniref:hypothetical protein n=1 Tax=Kitasatospora griseola TaxID=2064 RepID=UPI00380059CD
MSDEPIEPTIIQLSSERDDDGAPDPGPAAPPPPPPTEPPTAGIPPQPPGPGSWWRTDNGGAGSGPSPTPKPGSSDWNGGGGAAPAPSAGGPWGRGGAATMTAPAPPAPVTYVDAHELIAALTAASKKPEPAPARFDVRLVHPVRNGIALLFGVVLTETVWNKLLHVAGDSWGVIVAFLAAAGVLEWAYHDHRKLRWLVRVHTCSWLAAGVITPAGLLGIAWIGTGA